MNPFARRQRRALCAVVALPFAMATMSVMSAAPARAGCDLCAIYTGALLQRDRTGIFLGLSEQYTDFSTIREGTSEVANPGQEWMGSSTTQVMAGYAFTPWMGLQLNLPLIHREYRRLEEGMPVRGDVGGLGDLSVVGRFTPVSRAVGEVLFHVEMLAGIKAPTGDSDLLAEEMGGHHEEEEEHHDDGGHEHALRAGGQGVPASPGRGAAHEGHHHEGAIHGHDLALGTGSWDGIFGTRLYASWKRLFAQVSLQYIVRGNGDFGYEYADFFSWEAGPGLYLVAGGDWTTSLRLVTSGEKKGRDHQGGSLVDATAVNRVYVGPGLWLTWADRMSGELTVDLPVYQDVTGRQISPDYRLRAGLNWRF
ncbi:MAG: hypothetical protein ABR538_04430 [Candidatus Binatia bacterium]